jgi:hypothetical protein
MDPGGVHPQSNNAASSINKNLPIGVSGLMMRGYHSRSLLLEHYRVLG